MDPGSRPPSIHPFGPASAAAPSLAELRAQLAAAAQAYPELRRGLRAALADVDRALGVADAPGGHDARRRGEVTDRSPP